ncbi:PRC-barrel domain-containing protein [Desertimonas flava]|jgi:hypothetical protein|uniref:PRC-barrel domain-containing protein n=1 Tax=Desertimonas flava TaxID=2064846 RepID=UPI000E351BB1|nr:PRC-barrel domain-containing protein [Desertimonas flava]
MTNIWNYRADVMSDVALIGFDVEATDGHIGKVDDLTAESDAASLVVDTGFWIFGKKRVIPVGVIERIDAENETVYISMTKDQVKDAPDWRDLWWTEEPTRQSFNDYYGPFGW